MNLLITAIAPIVWGLTYIVTSDFLPPNRPILAGVLRALPAGLLILAYTRTLPKGKWWLKAAVLGALNIGGFFAALFLAAYLLPGGVAAVVTNTAPLVVMALAPFLLNQRILPIQVFAGILAVAGVAALVLSPGVHLSPAGVAAGLLASVCMGSGTIMAKKWGKPEGVPQIAVTGWQLVCGAILLSPLLAFEGLPAELTARNIGGYAFLTIFGSLVAYGVWFRGLARLDVVKVAVLGVLSPLTATLVGVGIKGEHLTPLQWAGGLAVLTAVFLAQGLPKRKM